MAKITIYQKPTCSTCRNVVKLVAASEQPYEAVDYYKRPFSRSELKKLLTKAGLKPRDVLRTKEDVYKSLDLARRTPSDDDLIDLMIEHPDLIQRPLVVKGDTVLLARPAERVKEIL